MPHRLVARTGAPLILPDEVREQLRVSMAEPEIEGYISTALEHLEGHLGVGIGVQTHFATYPAWPCAPWRLFPAPLRSVEEIRYRDADDALQTLASANYRVHNVARVGSVEIVANVVLPELADREDAVEVDYTVGYGVAPWPLPAKLRAAMLWLVTYQYEHRGDEERAMNRISVWDDALNISAEFQVYGR